MSMGVADGFVLTQFRVPLGLMLRLEIIVWKANTIKIKKINKVG